MIPESAVEAAVAAVEQETYGAEWARRIAIIAVQAAAPHMMAEAWDEGHHYGTRGQVRYQEDTDTNPYRPTP